MDTERSYTICAMKWIVPDALPPAPLCESLGKAFLASDPQVPALLESLCDGSSAEVRRFDVFAMGCSCSEWLRLQFLGAAQDQGMPVGPSLAALHAQITDQQQRVWLAQACSTIISTDKASLVQLEDLNADREDLLSLHQTIAQNLQTDQGPIRLELIEPGLWRVHADFPEKTWLATPQAVQGSDLGDWWPTEEHWKPWRSFLNEVQMTWHNHPVNTRREELGLPPINGLWLYGGGKGWQPQPSKDTVWIDVLHNAARQGNWQLWMNQYKELLNHLIEESRRHPQAELVLSAPDRIVTLRKEPRSRIGSFLPGLIRKLGASHGTAKKPWSNWWKDE